MKIHAFEEEAISTQEEILDFCHKDEFRKIDESPSFLDVFKDEYLDVAEYAFGEELFVALLSIVSKIDLRHPGVKSIFNNSFDLENKVSKSLLEILKLAQVGQFEGMYEVAPRMFRHAAKKATKSIAASLNDPLVRLLPKRKDRDYIRSRKEAFLLQPKFIDVFDFREYVRFNTAYKDQIKWIEEKAERYKHLGANHLYLKIKETLELLKLRREEYYGFNRITMSNAASILLKKHNRDSNSCVKVYSIHPASELCTEKFSNRTALGVIDHLEAFPPIGGKAIFDFYWLLMPTTNQSSDDDNFSSIEKKTVTPILLGEKDNKCFFLSFWV